MNRVILMGRLVRDPECRQSQSGLMIARFTVAVDRAVKKEGEQSADFISCIAFGKSGEFAEKYLAKGTKMVIEGRWQSGSYKNKDGQTVYTNDCVIDRMEFAESKKSESGNATQDEFVTVTPEIEEELPFV